MSLFKLLRREVRGSRWDILLAVVISGGANTAILAVVNSAAETASFEALNFRLFVIFAIALPLYAVALRYTFDAATLIFEQILTNVRARFVTEVVNSELLLLHQVGRARIFQSIVQDTSIISESQGLMVAAAHSAVMVTFTALYVLTMSLAAFLTIAGVVFLGATLYQLRQAAVMESLNASVQEEIRFIGGIEDLIDGLKEVKLSRSRGQELLEDLSRITASMRDLKIKTINGYNAGAVFAQCFFYVLIAIVVFVLPRLVEDIAPVVPQLVATILFLIGPLSTVVSALPALTKSNRAADSLTQLEHDLASMIGDQVAAAAPCPAEFAAAIEVRDVSFRYPGTDVSSFRIGPIDLVVPFGRIVMIIGGNGSGKTTFLKVLAGLYAPTTGSILLDGRLIEADRLQDYRELFSAIYSDFHLFRKLYGVAAEADEIDRRLRQMGIADKVRYGSDGFSNLDLSTGQRKRIGMVVTLLEDRPVLIFDEWAADQDPDFRRYFYEELLPELNRMGKTLLVATHDDRYFKMADIVVKMEQGRIQSIRRRRKA
jgi:putative ATP-binding cassette transporter